MLDLINKVKRFVKVILNKIGYDIVSLYYRKTLIDFLNYFQINVVYDVGANLGQFATGLRGSGYQGKIISFEPLSSTYQYLKTTADSDFLWQTLNYALGNYNGKAIINVAADSDFSSLRNPLPRLIVRFKKSMPVAKEEIHIRKLDSIFKNFYEDGSRYFLKVDTQGYEKEVIQGGINSLKFFYGIQLELPAFPLYEGQSSFPEMLNLLDDNGFQLVLVNPVNYHKVKPSVMDFDCIFVNRAFDN